MYTTRIQWIVARSFKVLHDHVILITPQPTVTNYVLNLLCVACEALVVTMQVAAAASGNAAGRPEQQWLTPQMEVEWKQLFHAGVEERGFLDSKRGLMSSAKYATLREIQMHWDDPQFVENGSKRREKWGGSCHVRRQLVCLCRRCAAILSLQVVLIYRCRWY